jgi:hypothetical protein
LGGFPGQGVFPAAAANNKYIHVCFPEYIERFAAIAVLGDGFVHDHAMKVSEGMRMINA